MSHYNVQGVKQQDVAHNRPVSFGSGAAKSIRIASCDLCSEEVYDGSQLRVAIVHARWNKPIIDALVNGAVNKLTEKGVKQSNIVVQSVPGSFELPLACSK